MTSALLVNMQGASFGTQKKVMPSLSKQGIEKRHGENKSEDEKEKSERSRRGRTKTRMLRTRMSIFEKQIQKNKEQGASSIPEGITTGLKRRPSLEMEGQSNFFVSPESRRRSLSIRNRNRETLECLADQLESVISSLNDHTHNREERQKEAEETEERSRRSQLRKVHVDDDSIGMSSNSTLSSSLLWNESTSSLPTSSFHESPPARRHKIHNANKSTMSEHSEAKTRENQKLCVEVGHDCGESDAESILMEDLRISRADQLRQELAEVQAKLENMPQKTKNDIATLREEYRRKRESIQQDVHDRLQMIINSGSSENKGDDIGQRQAEIDKMKNTIRLLRTSNAALRKKREKIQRGIDKLKKDQGVLERESEDIQEFTRLLTIRTFKLKEDNEQLTYMAEKCQRFCKPMWKEAILKNKIFGETEERKKKIYQETIRRIQAQVHLTSTNIILKDTIQCNLDENEKELDQYYKNAGVARLPLYSPVTKSVKWKDLSSEAEDEPTVTTFNAEDSDAESDLGAEEEEDRPTVTTFNAEDSYAESGDLDEESLMDSDNEGDSIDMDSDIEDDGCPEYVWD